MISPSYNIWHFLTAVQGKSYAELLATADRECAAAEGQAYGGRAGSVRASEQGTGEYAHDLKGFLFWLRYGRRPDDVDDSTFYRAFPDSHFTVEDLIAEGDKVVARFTMRATHQGEFMGIPPTGKVVTMTGIYIARIAGGKYVEDSGIEDQLGLMQQLGVIPQMAQTGA